MLNFNSITIEGFGSYGRKVTIQLNVPGIHLIRGNNGAGKTTMFSALTWCLFGKPLKEIGADNVQTWEHLRPKAWRGTRVILDLNIDGLRYVIARHIKFTATTYGIKGASNLFLFTRASSESKPELLPTGKVDTKKAVQDLLKTNFEVFTQSVLFGQRLLRLVQLSDADKRNVFETFFDLSKFDIAQSSAKTLLSAAQSKSTVLGQRIVTIQERIAGRLANIDKQTEILRSFEQDIAEEIESVEGLIIQTQSKLVKFSETLATANAALTLAENSAGNKKLRTRGEKLTVLESDLDKLDGLLRSAKKSSREALSAISEASSKIAQYEEQKRSVKSKCEVCGAPIKEAEVSAVKKRLAGLIKTEGEVKAALEKVLPQYESNIESLTEQVEKVHADIEALTDEIDALKAADKSHKTLRTNVENASNDVARAEAKIEALQAQKAKIKDRKKPTLNVTELRFNNDLDTCSAQDLALEQSNINLRIAAYEFWIKGFSHSGVKSLVFDRLLFSFNEALSQYIAPMGVEVAFKIDTSRKSKPFLIEVVVDEIAHNYNEFSGGEKQRIDIAIAFAMHDVYSSIMPVNIALLDELFESVDEEGLEFVAELIKLKASGAIAQSIWVITHTEVAINNAIEYTVTGGQKNGLSTFN